MAVRPKTLSAAVGPVIIGTAMAFGDGIGHLPSAVLALLGGILIQIATNLINDYFDFKKGADTHDRIGPLRVTQAGLVSAKSMKVAIAINLALIALVCVYLIGRGGPPIFWIAVVSVFCAFAYTAGPFPLAYHGLGEIFVLVFFGPVAVGGTYYVQGLELTPAVLIAGIAPGLFSVAILTVNNLRDIQSDRASGKQTLAVRFGAAFARYEYFYAVVGACLVPVVIYSLTHDYIRSLWAVGTLAAAGPSIRAVFQDEGQALNAILARTGQLLLLYSVLFSLGWVIYF